MAVGVFWWLGVASGTAGGFQRPSARHILLCCSMVILSGAFSTHLLGKERNRKLKARATVK
jgi:hypothetical protein